MFGKLVKHEFNATRRIVPFIWLATFMMAALNLIAGKIGIEWLANTSIFFLILLAIGQVIVTYVIVITRYYRSLYGDEGYLTHTLPVGAGKLLGSKLLTSFVWLMLSYFVAALVFLVIAIFAANQEGTSLINIYRDLKMMIGFKDWQIVAAAGLFILYIIYALILQLAQMFFAMSFGSQAKFHKLGLAGPIISYLILNFVLEIVMLVAMVFLPIGINIKIDESQAMPFRGIELVSEGMLYLIKNPESQLFVFGLGGIIFSIIAMAALYWGSYRLIKNRTSLR